MPPTGSSLVVDDAATDAEETILVPPVKLVPLRPLRPKRLKSMGQDTSDGGDAEFDPTSMDADQISVDIEIAPSTAFAYGTLVRNFLHLKVSFVAPLLSN